MANYVAHHTKKRERLARLEQDLERSIRNGVSRERQLHLADEVRLGRIKALRAERAEFVPASKGHSNRLVAIDEQLASLEAIAAEMILAEFVMR